MKGTEDNFKLEFEAIKKETHGKMEYLCKRFVNAKNWRVDFEYDWSVNCSSSIDKDDAGWYDQLKEEDTEEAGIEGDGLLGNLKC